MRHRAESGDAEALLGQHGGGAGKARDVARTGGHDAGFAAVRAAQAEIDQQLARRRKHHPRGLGGDQRLEMQDIDQPRLDQLRLGQRRGHAQDRLVGKEHRAFRHGMHVAGEAKSAQDARASPCQIGRCAPSQSISSAEKCRPSRKSSACSSPAATKKAAPGGKLANEELENRGLGLAVIQVRLDHVELVEIGQQRTRGVIHSDTLAQRNVRSPENIDLSHYPPIRRRELRNINAVRLSPRHQAPSNSGVPNAETEI